LKQKFPRIILDLQPLFPVPIYFSVLIGCPPLWLSLLIAVMPVCVRYWYTRHIFSRTLFDIPILLFIAGSIIFYSRTDWLQTTFATWSLEGRFVLWDNTLTLLKGKATFFGLGPGAWRAIYNAYFNDTAVHVHNAYIQLYCDAGILGFIGMVMAAVITLRFSIHILKKHRDSSLYWIKAGLISAVIAGAVFAVFDVTTTITYVNSSGYVYLALPLLWLFAAFIAVLHSRDKENHARGAGEESEQQTNR
jgi:O-antigen ligase